MSNILYAGYGDLWQRILDMAQRMPDVDAIAGVPVSGLAPAGMLSAATGVPCVPLAAVPDGVRRLLVLEDASGYAQFRQERIGQAPGRKVVYGAVYACGAALDLHLVGCVAEKPRIFAWNLTKSDRARFMAYDLDGVLCRNPTADEVDYGPRYAQFVDAAERIRCAPTMLGWIVTGRMERYRAATVAWLDRAGIRYRDLIMAGDDQAHTLDAHAKHKADWLAAHPECLLFVESHARQAARIAELTGRAVVCAETDEAWHVRAAEPYAARPVKRNDRIVYTVSTGAYEPFAPRAVRPPAGWDYRVVTSADCPAYLSPKQQAAWAKINGPRLFAQYDASLCVDDDMTILADPAPLFGEAEMATLYRPEAATWHADMDAVATLRRAATPEAVAAERQRLTAAGFADSANYMTGIIWRRHTPSVRALCDEWWYWYGQSETQRDQPALAVACQRFGYTPATFTQDGIALCIRHDSRRADRNGVRARVDADAKAAEKPRRKGDRL